MPRTITTTKTETITKTLGQIAFEAACPDGDWNLVPGEDKLRWEAAAEAVFQALEKERNKNDLPKASAFRRRLFTLEPRHSGRL